MDIYIKRFNQIGVSDIAEVGGKNSSLGEMYSNLSAHGILVPNGFAVTAFAFKHFIEHNKLDGVHAKLLSKLNRDTFKNLSEIGLEARKVILESRIPEDLADAILGAYKNLSAAQAEVAIRSSATAEDLPDASFAGQHESYLNIKGEKAVLDAVKRCYASLYTDRAIKYREDKGFEHSKVLLSVGVQLMIRSDKACSGIGFTLEPESGFRNVIHLAGVWGLGENIVQGQVIPDEFLLFKPALQNKKKAILQKNLGSKSKMMIYSGVGADQPTLNLDTPPELKSKFVLTDDEITQLGNWALIIEDHYQKPMDIEWAKDGETNLLYILQARPETVHSRTRPTSITEYTLQERGEVLSTGEAIGNKIAAGRAKILSSPEEGYKLEPGDILITGGTSPDWDPILKRVSAIVTDKGGRTSHASIVARELGVPAIVGTEDATAKIKDGEVITVSCAEGKTGMVYKNQLKWKEILRDFSHIILPDLTKVMMILGEPEKAFQLAAYPNAGVGLMRIEFIITHYIQIHPMALVKFNELSDKTAAAKIEELTVNYSNKEQFFIDKLAEGVSTIAAAFYPKEVIVRMSDLKTNEYSNLIGGKEFEPVEENPMLGFRGAARYYNERYKEAFRLECEAMKVVRNDMGLENVKLMIPFCRTPEEGRKVVDLMASYGLRQGENDLKIYVMAEIPSNVLLAEEFGKIFDGFSIGSNDLTQLTLGIDRDSSIIEYLFDEENPASKAMIKMMIEKAGIMNKNIGICGQAPSDSPAFAEFLVENGIDSISFNPDALLTGIENIKRVVPLKQGCSGSFYEIVRTGN